MFKPEDVLSRINDAVWVADLTTRQLIYSNPRLAEIWERPVETLKTSYDDWVEAIHPDDLEYYKARLQDIEKESSIRIEYRIVVGSKTKWVCDNIQLSNEGNSPGGILISTLYDTTKRKEAEQHLEKSEETYRYLFDNNPSPILIFDLETLRFLAINISATNIYGYSREEFLSMTLNQVVSPEHHEFITEHIKADIINFRDEKYWRHVLKNGLAIWTDVSVHRMIYNGRKAELMIISDVSKKVEAHEELARREQLLASLINSQTHYVMRLDIEGHMTFLNQCFLDKFGYTKEDLLGQHFTKITLPEDFEKCEAVLKKCIDHPRRIFPLTHYKIDADGNIFWTTWEFAGVSNQENVTFEIQGFGRDISEDKKLKEDLETKEVNLDALINNTDNLIWSIDKGYQLISANKSFKYYLMRSLGVQLDAGDSVLFRELGDDMARKWKAHYDKALAGKKYTLIHELDPGLPDSRKAEISFNPITNNNDEIIGVGCFAHDITERTNFIEQIVAQNKNLKKIASLASHEIRGPVASILGLVSLFDKSKISDPSTFEIVNYIEESMKQLDSVIHKIVEITYSLNPDVDDIKDSFLRNQSGSE